MWVQAGQSWGVFDNNLTQSAVNIWNSYNFFKLDCSLRGLYLNVLNQLFNESLVVVARGTGSTPVRRIAPLTAASVTLILPVLTSVRVTSRINTEFYKKLAEGPCVARGKKWKKEEKKCG